MKKYLYVIIGCLIVFSCRSGKKKEKQDVERINALMIKAEYLYKNDSYKKALDLFNEIIELDSTKGKIYYSRGYCWAEMDNFKKSNKDYLKSISLGFKVEESYFNLGCNQAILLDDSLAYVYFKKAFEINPLSQEAENQMKLLNNSYD